MHNVGPEALRHFKRTFRNVKAMLYSRPELLHHILEVNAQSVTDYLNAQIDADPATSEGLFVFSSLAVNAGDLVRVDMGTPMLDGRQIPVDLDGVIKDYPLTIEDKTFTITCVSMGNPHAVQVVDDVFEHAEALDLLVPEPVGPGHVRRRMLQEPLLRGLVGEAAGAGESSPEPVGLVVRALDIEVRHRTEAGHDRVRRAVEAVELDVVAQPR